MGKKVLLITFLLLFCISSVYAGDRRYVCQTLSYSATKSLSPPVRGDSYYFINSVTGNMNIAVNGGVQGDSCIFFLKSDAVAGRVITYGSGFTSAGTQTLVASQTSVAKFTYTGLTWKEEYRINGNSGPLPFSMQTFRFHPAEFAPSPDGAANSCIVSIAYDRTNYRNYFEINSGSATQDYDMVAVIKLPLDFGSFSANALSLDIYTVDFANSVTTVTIYKNDNSVDVNATSVITNANSAWQTKTASPATSGYTAGDNVKILIHIGTGNAASEYVRIGRIFLTYNTR
jgi:hypothetical protein